MQDLNDKVTGGTLTAVEWNEVPSEIQNVIEALDITLSSGDLNQLGKAIAGYVAHGDFYTDSGAANVYVLTQTGSKQAPTAYVDGMRVRAVISNANTGASTVNVVGLGVKSITTQSGTNPQAGEIDGIIELIFDTGNDRFEIVSRKITVQVFTASGTYNIPSDVRTIHVMNVGGGAGGGASGTTANRGGGGGGAGGFSEETLASGQLSGSETVTIGAGGAGGVAVAGTSGGTTSFGAFLSATGGVGGTLGTSTLAGAAGGVGAGGDVNGEGGSGGPAVIGIPLGSHGGGSVMGGGGGGGVANRAGIDAGPFGAGGGGGSTNDTSSLDGGDGQDGIVIVTEYR